MTQGGAELDKQDSVYRSILLKCSGKIDERKITSKVATHFTLYCHTQNHNILKPTD